MFRFERKYNLMGIEYSEVRDWTGEVYDPTSTPAPYWNVSKAKISPIEMTLCLVKVLHTATDLPEVQGAVLLGDLELLGHNSAQSQTAMWSPSWCLNTTCQIILPRIEFLWWSRSHSNSRRRRGTWQSVGCWSGWESQSLAALSLAALWSWPCSNMSTGSQLSVADCHQTNQRQRTKFLGTFSYLKVCFLFGNI